MGVGLEELKEARFSPLFYAGKNYKKLYVFSNDKGTLLLKKNFFYFDHDTLPLINKRISYSSSCIIKGSMFNEVSLDLYIVR